jgi:hypothetical protein
VWFACSFYTHPPTPTPEGRRKERKTAAKTSGKMEDEPLNGEGYEIRMGLRGVRFDRPRSGDCLPAIQFL